jgi:cardiolipin synthase
MQDACPYEMQAETLMNARGNVPHGSGTGPMLRQNAEGGNGVAGHFCRSERAQARPHCMSCHGMPRDQFKCSPWPESGRATRQPGIHMPTVLRLVLIACVLFIALVGFLFLTRGTAVRHVRAVSGSTPDDPVDPHFPLLFTLLTGTVVTPGNRVELAQDGDGTFPRLWEDLRSAERFILFQSYYGKPGRVADMLGEILAERAAAGVRVLALYDAFGSQRTPSRHLDALRSAGVEVVAFRPLRFSTLHLFQNRSHARAVVVDGRIGWTGGFGIDDKWLGDGRSNGGWRETNVRFEGPAVLQLAAAFVTAWTEATGDLFSASVPLPATGPGTSAGLLYASPTLGSTVAERFHALSIAGARRTLHITNAYFAPGDAFTGLLADAARRGVDVRILTAGPQTDVPITRLAGRNRYEALLEANARIYEWQPTTLHAKTFVVDGIWCSVGTMNFDNRSLTLNEEVSLAVHDPHFGARMDAMFAADLCFAEEITLERFRRRGWTARTAEKAVHLVERVL